MNITDASAEIPKNKKFLQSIAKLDEADKSAENIC